MAAVDGRGCSGLRARKRIPYLPSCNYPAGYKEGPWFLAASYGGATGRLWGLTQLRSNEFCLLGVVVCSFISIRFFLASSALLFLVFFHRLLLVAVACPCDLDICPLFCCFLPDIRLCGDCLESLLAAFADRSPDFTSGLLTSRCSWDTAFLLCSSWPSFCVW